MSFTNNRSLGSYELLSEIGAGGMGNVYHAIHKKLGREAAIKVITPRLASRSGVIARFENEARSIAALSHPNILPIWDYAEQDGLHYIVMPLVHGLTLHKHMEMDLVPLPNIVSYIEQAAKALDYAHKKGILHRDVKPANMLVDDNDHLFLADFGLARALNRAERLTQVGTVLGTADYMAPEQIRGEAEKRSDIYSLGVVLYELLTGDLPYEGVDTGEILHHHQYTIPDFSKLGIRHLRSTEKVEALILRAIAKRPEDRYQVAQELASDLKEAIYVLPSRQEVAQALRQLLVERGASGITTQEAFEVLGDRFGLSEAERTRPLPTGHDIAWENRVRFARNELRESGLLEETKRGLWKIKQ